MNHAGFAGIGFDHRDFATKMQPKMTDFDF